MKYPKLYAQTGLDNKPVYQVYEQVTGKPWKTARAEGLTDGTAEKNLALKSKLLSQAEPNKVFSPVEADDVLGSYTPAPSKPATTNEGISSNKTINADSFNEAFKIARESMGPNRIFEWNNKRYTTNRSGEKFVPVQEDLDDFNLDRSMFKQVDSPASSLYIKNPVLNSTWKGQTESYSTLDEYNRKTAELNSLSNHEKIVGYKMMHGKENDKNYVIVDKSEGMMYIYKPGSSKPFHKAAVGVGALKGDAQTVTKFHDLNKNFRTDPEEIFRKNVDWAAGSKTTGAGKYYISNINPSGYGGLPLFNMMNERQYEKYKKTGKVDNVSTSFHVGQIKDDDHRVSNGCIRCDKKTLYSLQKYLEGSSEVYILPEDKGNKYVIRNGLLSFETNARETALTINEDGILGFKEQRKDYEYYTDEKGKRRKGQGVNVTKGNAPTIKYIPIEIQFDEKKFYNEKYHALDWRDDEQKENVKQYVNTLQNSKQKVMELTKVNGDVMNEIIGTSFGIFGVESDFGDLSSFFGLEDAARAGQAQVQSFFSKNVSGRPSTEFEAWWRGSGEDADVYSLGVTQVVWKNVSKETKEILKGQGINHSSELQDPRKAALATMIILAQRYKNQINNPSLPKEILKKKLANLWNKEEKYPDRVERAKRYINIYQKD